MPERNLYEKHILDAALHTIAKHSISGTRMKLIAEEAGMTASNLLYHFKNKRELLLALLHDLQDYFQQLRYSYVNRSEDSLESKLAAFFEQKKQLLLHEPERDQVQFDFWVLGQSDPEINCLFRKTYTLWHQHIVDTILYYRPELEQTRAEMAAYNMVSTMMGGTMQYLSGEGVDLELYFQDSLEMVLGWLNQEA